MAHNDLLWPVRPGQGKFGEMAAPDAQIGDFDALQAEQDRQFPTVMQVMGHDVPDGSLARNQVHLPVVKMAIGLRQIGERPGGERGFNDLPE